GLCVLFGYRARAAALVLALYLIPVTAVFHRFWTNEGKEKENQMQHFMKNAAIFGGLLTLSAAGAGSLSLDALRARAASGEASFRRSGPDPISAPGKVITLRTKCFGSSGRRGPETYNRIIICLLTCPFADWYMLGERR